MPARHQPRDIGDILTIGFGVVVVMWAVGFLARLPIGGGSERASVVVPSWLLLTLLAAVMLIGGVAAERLTGRGLTGGVLVGLTVGLLNLLIIGGIIMGASFGQTLANAVVWVPGTLAVSITCTAVGALLAGGARAAERDHAPWLGRFAAVGATATALLIMVGGTVTGFDAGLAVVDWPNTEGYLMFLYPLSKMAGGIYFEHSHRLIGTLVGLTTLVLAIYAQRTDRRPWLKRLAWIALALVVVQGLLGGLRVTGRLTWSTDPNDTAPSIVLAIVHGVFGQVFFSIMVALAVFTAAAWRRQRPRSPSDHAATDRTLGLMLYVVLLGQLVLGALVRHLMSIADRVGPATVETLLNLHITLAVLVALITIGVGARAAGLYGAQPVIRRCGVSVMVLLGVQVLLGIAAYIVVVGGTAKPGEVNGWHVLFTTLHQTVGALLLGNAVLLVLWNHRLLEPTEQEQPAPSTA